MPPNVPLINVTISYWCVKLQPEFIPFFTLDYLKRATISRKRRAPVPHARVPVLLNPADRPADLPKTFLPLDLWPEIHGSHTSGESLRELARCYGVSHEAIRGIVQRSIQGVAQASRSDNPRQREVERTIQPLTARLVRGLVEVGRDSGDPFPSHACRSRLG